MIRALNIFSHRWFYFIGSVAGTIYIDPYARDDKLDHSYHEMGRGIRWNLFLYLKWQIQVFYWFQILQDFDHPKFSYFRSQWSCWHHTSVLRLSSNQSFLWWKQAHFNAVWWYSKLHHECKYSLKAPYLNEVKLFGFM